jgi:4-amino-4-deoxy-L-arabinose transferase-like glycosyltransferase
VVGINPRAVLIVQAILDAITVVLVVGTARHLRLSWRAALVAGLLYALYPAAWRYSAELYVETALAFVVAVTFWLFTRPRNRWTGVVALGVMCGLALLLKPNVLLLPVILAIAVLLRWGVRQALVFAAAVVLLVTPWVVRNTVVFGRPMLSTAFENNLARVSAPATLAEARGEDVAPWTPRWEALYGEVVRAAAQQAPDLFATPLHEMSPRMADQATLVLAGVSRDIIAAHPIAFVESHVKGVLRGLLPDEYRFWFAQFTGRTWESAMPGGIAAAVREGGWQSVPWLAAVLFVAFTALYAIGYALAVVGLWRLGRIDRVAALALGLSIAYMVVLPGSITYERFILPVMPLGCVLIGCAALARYPPAPRTGHGALMGEAERWPLAESIARSHTRTGS